MDVEFIGCFEGCGFDQESAYLVTSIRPQDELRPTKERCWGWFKELKQAQEAVETNAGDMMETTFRYVVIEKVLSGVPSISEDVVWYTWTGEYPKNGRWWPCEKPSWANGVVGWSIG